MVWLAVCHGLIVLLFRVASTMSPSGATTDKQSLPIQTTVRSIWMRYANVAMSALVAF